MLYLEHKPSPPLADCIRTLWYTRDAGFTHQRERVLPSGSLQIVINLAADTLTDCGADTNEEAANISRPMPGAIIAGARRTYDIIHTRDLTEIVGIVFRPGGFAPWLRHRADDFFQQSIDLHSVWNQHSLLDRLHGPATPAGKLLALDRLLVEHLRGRTSERDPTVKAALSHLRCNSVRSTARYLSISDRRLHQIVTQDAGLSPKLWSRIHRFQTALHALHRGKETRWDQLALDCGYYDQPHFANDFHAFSGIDPTTYTASRGPWRNHVPLD